MAPSFLDRARGVAQQALDEARKGIDEGQSKLDELQVKKRAEKLLTELGAAFYAEQRGDGDREQVDAALSAVDAHIAEHGQSGFPNGETQPPPPPPPPAAPTSPR